MSALIPFVIAFSMQTTPNPLLLDIGRRGTVKAELGLTNLATGRRATISDIVDSARGKRFVYLGENHATTAHQQFQADVISALSKSGRPVVIGLEMITRPLQDPLDQWTSGTLGESEFLEKVDWKRQWGFDYSFYKPVFDVAKERKLPLVALNVPREWVRTVGRGGFNALSVSARLQLPKGLTLDNRDHRRVFEALLGGHPVTGPSGDNMYSAQVLWDEGMADTALKWLERLGQPDHVFVVLAGAGHVMYGQGINFRVQRRNGGDGVTVVMNQTDSSIDVAKGLGDFVYLSKPVPAASSQ